MATFDFTLTDADVGTVLTPADGYLVSLSQTSPPTRVGPPQATPAGVWLDGGYLQLGGERDVKDLYCAQPATAFMSHIGKELILVANHSLPYRGGLAIKALPKGSTIEISLSDVELTEREKSERANARQRKELEAAVAKLQRKADDLAPLEPAPPMLIERPRERVTVRERRR